MSVYGCFFGVVVDPEFVWVFEFERYFWGAYLSRGCASCARAVSAVTVFGGAGVSGGLVSDSEASGFDCVAVVWVFYSMSCEVGCEWCWVADFYRISQLFWVVWR